MCKETIMTLKISHDIHPDAAIINEIEKSLEAYNFTAVGAHDRVVLLLSARDDNGMLQAGLKGLMGWNWLSVTMLWVSEAYRGKGYGSMLLCQAEEIAKTHGCTNAILTTHSFHAPDFYKKQGYKEFGRLENFPPGHSKSFFSKTF